MDTSHIACSDRFLSSSPHHVIEALGRLQIQDPNPYLENLYIYDLVDQRTLFASCSIAAMLGYTADAIQRMDAVGLGNLIHPKDLKSVSQYYQRFSSLQSSEVITISYRMKQADGAWCWLYSQETPLVMAIDGFPLQIVGIVRLMPRVLASPLRD